MSGKSDGRADIAVQSSARTTATNSGGSFVPSRPWRLYTALLLLSGLSGGAVLLLCQPDFLPLLSWERNRLALAELALSCAVLALIQLAAERALQSSVGRGLRRYGLLAGGLLLLLLYLHQSLWAVLVSGLYFAGLVATLFVLWRCLDGGARGQGGWFAAYKAKIKIDTKAGTKSDTKVDTKADTRPDTKTYTKVKAVHCASIPSPAVQRAGKLGPAALWRLRLRALSLSLPFFLIQLNRLNIAVDYDSLRYGVRGNLVLGLAGFFEPMGQLNVVHTYPKGLELLLLPLSYAGSYAFVTAFQFWQWLACLGLCLYILRCLGAGERSMALGWVLLSSVPALGNMAVTAKTDMITLLCQLCLIACALRGELWGVGAAALLSLCFKPTALPFSLALLLGLGLAAVWARYAVLKVKGSGGYAADSSAVSSCAGSGSTVSGRAGASYTESDGAVGGRTASGSAMGKRTASGRAVCGRAVASKSRFFKLCFGLAALYLLLLSLRTWHLTGLPMTSVFTSLWQRLGFQVKWPYNFEPLPGNGLQYSLPKALKFWLGRVLRFWWCPLGEDMAHVRMAWGGPVFPLSLGLAAAGLWRLLRFERVRRGWLLLGGAWLGTSALSLLSLFLLWQVDGNYYLLWYCLSMLLALSALSAFSVSAPADSHGSDGSAPPGQGGRTAPDTPEPGAPGAFAAARPCGCGGRILKSLLALALAESLLICLLSGWAGAVGFTPLRPRAFGYYAQQRAHEEYARAAGCLALWRQLETEPGRRVLAFAPAPECYYLQCNVQSYTDVEGSGGNVRLVKKLNGFKRFLVWAETDTIYIDSDFLRQPGRSRALSLLYDLIEDGTLTELQYVRLPDGHFFAAGQINADRAAQDWEVPMPKMQRAEALRAAQTFKAYLQALELNPRP